MPALLRILAWVEDTNIEIGSTLPQRESRKDMLAGLCGRSKAAGSATGVSPKLPLIGRVYKRDQPAGSQ